MHSAPPARRLAGHPTRQLGNPAICRGVGGKYSPAHHRNKSLISISRLWRSPGQILFSFGFCNLPFSFTSNPGNKEMFVRSNFCGRVKFWIGNYRGFCVTGGERKREGNEFGMLKGKCKSRDPKARFKYYSVPNYKIYSPGTGIRKKP